MTVADRVEPRGAERVDTDISVVAAALQVLPFVCLGAIAALLVRVASLPLGNPDTWFHLRLGHEFLAGWSIRSPGATTQLATADWVPTQWSTQIAMAAVEDWFGLAGVAWLFGALYLGFVAALYLVSRRGSGPLPAAVVCVAAVFGCSASLSARPQVVSLIFLVVTVGAWLKTGRDGKLRWWLVPLTWVWATAHGFWSIGVLIGLVSCLGLALDRSVDFKHGMRLLAVPVLSLVAACLTPVGPRLLFSQLAVSERSGLISEWGSTSFRSLHALVAAGMLVLLLLLLVHRGRAVRWMPLLLALLAGALTVYAVRLVAVGVVIAAPLLAAAMDDAAPTLRRRLARREVVGVVGIMGLAAVTLGMLVPQTAAAPANVPSELSSELQDLPPGAVVLVDSAGTGSWLGWAHPSLQPTVDGMFDAYQLSYLRDHYAAVDLESGWRDFVESANPQAAVLRIGSPFAVAVVEELGWRVTERADGREYLTPPAR